MDNEFNTALLVLFVITLTIENLYLLCKTAESTNEHHPSYRSITRVMT